MSEEKEKSFTEKKDEAIKNVGNKVSEFSDKSKKVMGSLLKKLMVLLVILSVLGVGVLYLLAVFDYSEGYRAGNVVKMSKKGYIFKTYEGQLKTGGMDAEEGSDITSTVWNFTVPKNADNIRQEIESAVDGGYRVKLHYDEKLFQLDFLGDTKYFVKKVERIGGNQ